MKKWLLLLSIWPSIGLASALERTLPPLELAPDVTVEVNTSKEPAPWLTISDELADRLLSDDSLLAIERSKITPFMEVSKALSNPAFFSNSDLRPLKELLELASTIVAKETGVLDLEIATLSVIHPGDKLPAPMWHTDLSPGSISQAYVISITYDPSLVTEYLVSEPFSLFCSDLCKAKLGIGFRKTNATNQRIVESRLSSGSSIRHLLPQKFYPLGDTIHRSAPADDATLPRIFIALTTP